MSTEPDTAQKGLEPAAATSPLAGMRSRLAKAREHNYTDLRVEGIREAASKAGVEFSGDIYVRYRTLSGEELTNNTKKWQALARKGQKNTGIRSGMDALNMTCLGVFYVDDEDPDTKWPYDETNPHREDWPTFTDPGLAYTVGVEDESTDYEKVLQALFPSDGAMMRHVADMLRHSGLTEQSIEGLRGE